MRLPMLFKVPYTKYSAYGNRFDMTNDHSLWHFMRLSQCFVKVQYTTCPENVPLYSFALTVANADRFFKSFTDRLSSKYAAKR